MKTDRILEMEKYICQRETATMTELSERFDVSMNTIRRDVSLLLKRGAVDKVYGGVCARHTEQTLTPYEERRTGDETAKMIIGQRAAQMVQDDDVIFVDSGTTTLHLIDALSQKKNLTIITHNLGAIIRSLPYDNINVIALPGQLRRRTNSFTGYDAVRILRQYNIRTAFMAATGISQNGVTNSSSLEFEIKKAALESAEKNVLLMCANKFGKAGLMTYATVDDFDVIITEKNPVQEYADVIAHSKANLVSVQNI